MNGHNGLRVALHFFGCKLNQSEVECMALDFAAAGFDVVEPDEEADAYVVNTCTVTGEADRQLRQWLRSVRRHRPASLLVAVGCAVERDREQMEGLADIVAGNAGKGDVVNLVRSRLDSLAARTTSAGQPAGLPLHGRNRAMVRVQEGCLAPCAYCIVPLVRRGEVSTPLAEVLAVARERIAAGHRELVLTGTRPGAYRDGDVELSDVVRAVLELPGLGRVRVSSLQPQELSPSLLALWPDSRLCPHFHLSLQSGSATVLRRMARGYTPGRFMQAVDDVRRAAPGAAVTTDVIVGFPGESDREFEESLAFCERVAFSRIHVFPFSPRPGTRAAAMDGRVPAPVVKERVKVMLALAQRSADAYVESLRGRRVQALWEEETAPGSGEYVGTSGNYLRLIRRSGVPLYNVLEDVVVDGAEGDRVRVWREGEDTGGSEAKLEDGRR